MKLSHNENCHTTNYWNTFNDDITNNICSYLPFEDILKLGVCSRENHYVLSQKDWKDLKSIKYFDFKFSDSPKNSYLLCKAIHAYVHNRKINISHEEATKIYKSFESLMIKSPSFGAYLWSDLTHLCPTVASTHYQTFEENLGLLQKYENVKCGGDLLLCTLYAITVCESDQNVSFSKISDISMICMKAIEAGATCASYFAYKILQQKCNQFWHFSLGSLSYAKGDSRALDHLCNDNYNYTSNFYNCGVTLPSVLATMVKKTPMASFGGDNETNKNQLETVLSRAILAYGSENLPLDLLESSDFLLKNTNQRKFFNQYQSYLSKALIANDTFINLYDGYIDVDYRISNKHFYQGNWKEAEKIYDKLNKNNTYPLSVMIRKAYTKLKLEKWQEALVLYNDLVKLFEVKDISYADRESLYYFTLNQTLPSTTPKFQIGLFLDLGYVVLKLKRYEEALDYYHNIIKESVFRSDEWDYSAEAFKEWKQILDKIIGDINEEGVPILKKSALISIQARGEAYFENWDKVITLLNPRIKCIDRHVLYFVEDTLRQAQAYFKLKKWEIAEKLYDDISNSMEPSSIERYSRDTMSDDFSENVDFYRDYAFIKIQLGKLDVAESICRQSLDAWMEDTSTKQLVRELTALCGEEMPPFLINLISENQS